uniref:Metallothionein n=1 Tax=Panagrolaimus davidi TaxID=227884 RepID=A0A914PAJ3_9BILA
MVTNINAYINCCQDPNGCTNACSQQHCAYMLCCSSGCTVGGQNIPPCACACANCPNQALAASGLLGAKFAPAKLLADETFKIAKV